MLQETPENITRHPIMDKVFADVGHRKINILKTRNYGARGCADLDPRDGHVAPPRQGAKPAAIFHNFGNFLDTAIFDISDYGNAINGPVCCILEVNRESINRCLKGANPSKLRKVC
jgi:hypothetical protein